MTDEILQKLASASSPEEVKSCLEQSGFKLVSSGEQTSESGPPADDPTEEEAPKASPFSEERLAGAAKKAMDGPSRKEQKASMKAEAKKAFGGGYGN